MKMITDVHTHSDFSFDGRESLSKILETAYKKGVAFYGVSEHFDGEIYLDSEEMAKIFAASSAVTVPSCLATKQKPTKTSAGI